MSYGELKHSDNGLLGCPMGSWNILTMNCCVQHKLPAPHHPHQKWQGSLERDGEEWISVCDCHHLLFGYLCFTIHHLLLSCYVVSTVSTFAITCCLSEVSCMYNCLCLLLSDPLSRISENVLNANVVILAPMDWHCIVVYMHYDDLFICVVTL